MPSRRLSLFSNIFSILLILFSLNNYLFPRCGCASICLKFYETPIKYIGREYWVKNTFLATQRSQVSQNSFGPEEYGCIGRGYGFVYMDLLVVGVAVLIYGLVKNKSRRSEL